MYKKIRIKVTGVQPLMLNNVQSASPLNAYAKQLKEVTGKSKKTDIDHLEIARIQFYASWYVDKDGHYVLPSDNLLKSFEEGAKEFKKGKKLVENVQIIEDNLLIEFKGKNKSLEELFDGGNGECVDTRICGISSGFSTKKVTATRALINEWSLTATVCFDDAMLNLADLKKAMENAGLRKGVGTYRRRFGRYSVEILK